MALNLVGGRCPDHLPLSVYTLAHVLPRPTPTSKLIKIPMRKRCEKEPPTLWKSEQNEPKRTVVRLNLQTFVFLATQHSRSTQTNTRYEESVQV